MSPIRFLLFLSLLPGLTACRPEKEMPDEAVPYYNTPDFTPIWPNDAPDAVRKVTHRITDFSFHNQNNQLITQDSVAGKIHVANFFFSVCPSVCPRMMGLLKTVQDTFRYEPRVSILSFSVMPWVDSVARLRQYAHKRGIVDHKWHLLTGEKKKIYTLARRSYFAEEAIGFTKDSAQFLHTEHLILVDANRRIRGVYNGTVPLDVDKLITDIRLLLNEKPLPSGD